MKSLCAIVLFISSAISLSFAQGEKFEFGLSIFPNYSPETIRIISDTFPSGHLWVRHRGKISYSVQIIMEYHLNDKSAIGIGQGYQNTGEQREKYEVTFWSTDSTGFPTVDEDPSLPTHVGIYYNFHNYEFPIYYKRKFGKRFYIQPGISGTFNVASSLRQVKYFQDGSKESVSEDWELHESARRFNLTANLGMGLDYFTNEKMTLFLHPYIQSQLLDGFTSDDLSRNYLSIGLSTGIRI